MEAFPSNSKKSKEVKQPVEKKIQKVTTGQAILKKKSIGDRFKNVFLGTDFKSVVRYVGGEVLLPAMKNMLFETVKQGTERAIYGDAASYRRRNTEQIRPRVSYNAPVDRIYGRSSQSTMLPHQPPHYGPQQPGRRQTVGDIILSSRSEAELVIDGLKTILDQYDTVSIADLYELVGLPSSHVDHLWGWMNLGYISARQTREGYVIDLPPAESL